MAKVTGELYNILGRGQNQKVLSVKLSFTYDEPQWQNDEVQSVEFLLSVQAGDKTAELKAQTNFATAEVSVVAVLTDPLTLCLLKCAGKALLGPLIECFNKDIGKYLECLRSKGLSIAIDVVACSAECVADA